VRAIGLSTLGDSLSVWLGMLRQGMAIDLSGAELPGRKVDRRR
jgi:hypothetical protein